MKRRTPVIAVIVAVAVSAIGLGPAHAALDDPVVADLDASTAGHVTGTVTSIAPFVRVRLDPDVGATVVTMTEGSGTFDLETWGYAGTRSVYVSSCEVAEPTQAEDCSTEIASTATFVPTDVSPEVTWPSDTTLGPEDSAPTITVSDPLGGGDLRALWVNGDDLLATDLVRDVATPVDIPTGAGVIRVVRCSAGSTTICTPFNPDLSIPIELRAGVTGTLGPIDALTTMNPTSTAVVDTDVTGTYELSWTLEQEGTPVDGVGGADSGVLTGDGATDPFTIEGAALPDGQYDVVVTLNLTGTEYGDLPGGASGTVAVDTTGPAVTLSRSVGTIYPLVATVAYPALTQIAVAGDRTGITRYVVRSSGGTTVRTFTVPLANFVWDGRGDDGKVVWGGAYEVYALDADGNRSASSATVTVSRQVLVLKKFVQAISASGSMYGDRKIGVCSQLKIPSSRGIRGSLGYYANTKCRTSGFAASAVSTQHYLKVPTAVKYLDMRIDVTGGAAVGYRGSKGVLRYLKRTAARPDGYWVNETVMSTDYGIHRGPTQSLTGMLDPSKNLVWGFLTQDRNRYDVIRFTVVVRYYALS